jgi:hypothetical protein
MDTLRSYFNKLINESLKADNLELNTTLIDYIIDMLVTFTNHESLGPSGEGMPVLAWYYKDAVNLKGQMRFNAFRRLGDTALFLTGFFSNYVNATGGLGYYIDMGCGAYDQASTTLGMHAIMHELSRKFTSLVSMLNYAANETTLGQTPDLRHLFELYAHVPSPTICKRLITLKAVPIIGIRE